MAGLKSVQVMISGRVQGVGFRAWTKANARKAKLSGWVCNKGDGSVHALFSGKPEAVDAMVEQCKLGPLACRVQELIVRPSEQAATGEFELRRDVQAAL